MASAYAAQAVPGQQYPGGGPQAAPPPGSAAGGGAGGPPVPDSYFTESRKGEISELRNLLRGFAAERDPARKRDIIKKVIAYMTLGIDVSRLFSDMMLAIETRCVVQRLTVSVSSSSLKCRKNRF
jgi:AP-4 complex subunit beta-1